MALALSSNWSRFWRWFTLADAPVNVVMVDQCAFCEEPSTCLVTIYNWGWSDSPRSWRTCLKHMNTPRLETLRGGP